MAVNATIGALRVELGLDSAKFQNGLKQSQGVLKKFGVQLTLSLETIGSALGKVVGAFPEAIKGAIDHADAMSKAAQKAGTTTEALSRLAYAADFSDVSLDTLTSGLGKLSKAMSDAVLSKTSSSAIAFKALGIQITDANGQLRNSDAVFADISDRFSKLENGATKTALAMQIFGRSGADMIPLLNSGSAELKRMADEADRLGITISTETGKSAERFNDTLNLVGKILQGVTNKVAEAALPALQDFATFLASPEFAQAAATFGSTLINVLAGVAQAIAGITNAARDLFTYLSKGSSTVGLTAAQIKAEMEAAQKIISSPTSNSVAIERSTAYLTQLKKQLAALDFMDPVGGSVSFGDLSSFGFGTGIAKGLNIDFGDFIHGAKDAKGAVVDLMNGIDDARPKIKSFAETISDTLTSAFTGFADALLNGVPAGEAFIDMLGSLAKQLANAAIGNIVGGIFGTGGFGNLFGTGGAASIRLPPLYANGGVTDRPAIFGDKGPEAAVPLPDGRTIPVTLSGDARGQVVNNVYNYAGADVSTQDNSTGGIDVIINAVESRIKGNMAKGRYRSLGVSPGMNRR